MIVGELRVGGVGAASASMREEAEKGKERSEPLFILVFSCILNNKILFMFFSIALLYFAVHVLYAAMSVVQKTNKHEGCK